MKGEKYKINEIKKDIDEHSVSESQKNVSDRPQKQVQGTELIEKNLLHCTFSSEPSFALSCPSLQLLRYTGSIKWS